MQGPGPFQHFIDNSSSPFKRSASLMMEGSYIGHAHGGHEFGRTKPEKQTKAVISVGHVLK